MNGVQLYDLFTRKEKEKFEVCIQSDTALCHHSPLSALLTVLEPICYMAADVDFKSWSFLFLVQNLVFWRFHPMLIFVNTYVDIEQVFLVTWYDY